MLAKNVHRISAIFLIVFVIAHLGNHLVAAWGPTAFGDYLSIVRSAYRRPYVEAAIIILLIVQAASGLSLAVRRTEPRNAVSWIELISALIFLPFIIVHLAAVAVTRYFFQIDTDFYWVAEMMKDTPARPYIIAFHALGVIAVTVHIGAGLNYLAKAIGAPAIGPTIMRGCIGFGLLVSAAGLAGYAGLLVTG